MFFRVRPIQVTPHLSESQEFSRIHRPLISASNWKFDQMKSVGSLLPHMFTKTQIENQIWSWGVRYS
jgi:hypothetical protein